MARYFRTVLSFLAFLFVGLLAFDRPHWLLQLGNFGFLPALLLLLLCFTPARKVKLVNVNSKQRSISLALWFLKVFFAYFLWFAFSIGGVVAFFGAGPAFAEGGIPFSLLQEVFVQHTLKWGIFPFGLYGFWGLSVAYVVYVKAGKPYIYQLGQGILPAFLHPSSKTFIEGIVSGATHLGYALAASVIILFITHGVEALIHLHHFAVPFVTMLVFSTFILMITFFLRGKWIKHHKNTFTLNRIYTGIILLGASFLLFAAIANGMFVRHYPEYLQLVCEQCGNYFANLPLPTRLAAFLWGWGLVWLPLFGSYIARIAYGRTVFTLVIGVVVLPFFFFSLIFWKAAFIIGVFSKLMLVATPMLLLLGGLGLWLLSRITMKNIKRNDFFYSGFMEVKDIPRDRLSLNKGTKVYGLGKSLPKLFMMVMGTLFLHGTAGWYGVQFQVAAMGGMLMLVLYIAFLLFTVQLLLDNAFLNNQNITSYS